MRISFAPARAGRRPAPISKSPGRADRPESSMIDYKRPAPTIPRIPGNSPYADFIRACKGGPPACSNFEVSGPFTETVLLGNLVLRVGKKIEWDSANLRVKNAPEADQYIHGHYRKGWKV